MAFHRTEWGERFWRLIMHVVVQLPGLEKSAPPNIAPEVEAYQSAMTTDFNRLHEKIFPRFFQKIQVEDYSLAPLAALPEDSSRVYVTPTIGQLEYNYFNYLYIQHQMPLPQLANGLSAFFWHPLGDCKRQARLFLEYSHATGHLPSPIRTGLWQKLIEAGIPTLIRLTTSNLHDDLYWDDPQEDPLTAVIQAAQATKRPIYCIPQDFIWDKHPEREHSAFTTFLLGDRDSRGPFRRLLNFFQHYRRRAIAKFGAPLHVQTWLSTQPEAPLSVLVQNLRAELFNQLRIERTAITGPGIKPRKWLMDQVVHSDSVQRCIYELAQDSGKPVARVQELALRYADEIAADPHHSVIEATAHATSWALRTLYDGITVDEDGLQKVKRAMGLGPIVLVPNHRSHMDYVLISTILYKRNVAVPFIASGINLNFWPFGPFSRKCGSFYLRRSFSGNLLYKAVFQAYITELVHQHYCQEFFIEGTRSRTGKMSQPKLGMLSMLVDSWRNGAAPDITFIPVAVTYDQVMEVSSYSSELQGARKAKERAIDMLKLGNIFRRRWGHVYLRFGDPISLAQASQDMGNDAKPQLVQHMAQSILYAINRETVVTPAAIASMLLLFSQGDAPSSFETLLQNAKVLIDYLVWKNAPCSPGLASMPEIRLRETLERLASAKQVTVTTDSLPVMYSASPTHRTQLDYTKNTGLHFFVSVACLARLLLQNVQDPNFDKILHHYSLYKQLFKYEFNFSVRREITSHLQTIRDYLQGKPLPLFAGLLDSYFEAYRCLFEFARTPNLQKGSEKTWFKQIQTRFPQAVSKSIFQNGLMLLSDLGVIQQHKDGDWIRIGISTRYTEIEGLLSI